MARNNRARAGLIVAGVFFALLGIVPMPGGQTASADLPPRPSPEPTLPPAPPGGLIALQVTTGENEPWADLNWQDLWTVVQWQDGLGGWHDVEGWRGTLDEIETREGETTGTKVWWIAGKDLGTGPFRWQVFREMEGELLDASEPFFLPNANGSKVWVAVLLAP